MYKKFREMKHLRPNDEENMENTDPDDDDLMW
jgi:hypothetical protein